MYIQAILCISSTRLGQERYPSSGLQSQKTDLPQEKAMCAAMRLIASRKRTFLPLGESSVLYPRISSCLWTEAKKKTPLRPKSYRMERCTRNRQSYSSGPQFRGNEKQGSQDAALALRRLTAEGRHSKGSAQQA